MNNKANKFALSVFGLSLLICCNNSSEGNSKDKTNPDSTIRNVSDEKKPSVGDLSNNKTEEVKEEKIQDNSTTPSSVNSDDLKLVKATSQKWAGGARGSGTGTYYYFTFIANLPSNLLNIDEIWIGQKYFKTIQSASPIINKPDFKSKDSVFIKVNDLIPGELNREIYKQDSVNKVSTPPPMKYNGMALIGYLENNKRKYLTVTGFKELPRLNYP